LLSLIQNADSELAQHRAGFLLCCAMVQRRPQTF
jgi:hypothetical protein